MPTFPCYPLGSCGLLPMLLISPSVQIRECPMKITPRWFFLFLQNPNSGCHTIMATAICPQESPPLSNLLLISALTWPLSTICWYSGWNDGPQGPHHRTHGNDFLWKNKGPMEEQRSLPWSIWVGGNCNHAQLPQTFGEGWGGGGACSVTDTREETL